MHEDIFTKKIRGGASMVSLSREEKSEMRARLVAFIEAHPQEAAPSYRATPSPFSISMEFFHRHIVAPALIALIALSGTGITAYAAESALPGETLYSMKVHVNEEVYNLFLLSDASRLAWLGERAERRLKEAGELAATGLLDSTKATQVLNSLAEHISEAAKLTESVAKEDPATAFEASSELEATLESEGSVLARLAIEESAPGTVRAFAEATAEQARGVSEMREAAEIAVLSTTTTAYADATLSDTGTLDNGIIDTPKDALTEEEKENDPREQALAKLEEKTSETLAYIEEKLNARSAETETERTSNAFVEEAQRLRALSAEKRDTGNYRGALEAIRKSYALAVQTRAMLEAETLFSMHVLPEEITETETGRTVPEQVSTSELDRARESATQALKEVRDIFEQNGLPTGVSERVMNNMKEAQTYILRAEIQMVLQENAKAIRLFKEAQASALRAKEILRTAKEEGYVAPLPLGAPSDVVPATPVASSSTPVSLPADIPDLSALDTVRVYHSFDGASNTHTYRGVFVTPTPCFTLTADARIAESFPEQITLVLTTKETGEVCVQMLDEKPFEVQVRASQGATLSGVVLNGEASKFEIKEETGVDVQMPVPNIL